ncbi:hypothetical protein QTO34_000171 [Cnephaeus nilssonii]|uniref:Uncharacterized protein n=1 Tax=Cnephaeus nilssonii TaxID=3371016 RepID=A0AA40IC27_CNENI|nr:hypothetical protein QTO34_000171 [Eptesicus nilssonii]
MEADIACHLMTPDAQTDPAAVLQEVTVSGSLLAIRLTAEDTDQLRLSITSCLQDLLLVIRTMRHILPPFVLVSPNRSHLHLRVSIKGYIP